MNTNTAIIIEAMNLKSNRRRLYLSNLQFNPGTVISVDFRCTDGTNTALAVVTGSASADDPRLEGALPTHRVREYYSGPFALDYNLIPVGNTGDEDEDDGVDLTEDEED